MMYAWPSGEVERTDLTKRIDANDHPNAEGVCPSCGNTVVSQFLNGVWQWVHYRRCRS